MEPLTDADKDDFMRIHYAAFEPVFQVFYHKKPLPESFKIMARERSKVLQSPATRAFEAVESGTGKMVAGIVWKRHPEGISADEILADLKSDTMYTPEQNVEAWKAVRALFAQLKIEVVGTRPLLYLAGLVVDPEYHGKGIGTLLAKWGVEEADK
jgi:ribosomal protein S18 acetylase RimI-like enzyme